MRSEPGVNGVLSARVVAGTHVAIVAIDVQENAWREFARDLLGFAIERTEFDDSGKELERYWLRGMKRFEHKDEGVPPGTLLPTSEHPIQSFQWGDYTVKPGHAYRYRIVPVRGAPKLLELRDADAVTVDVTTEREKDQEHAHAVYFNRGVAGSQAYVRKFTQASPDENDPESTQMKWLSRGLYEALVEFIGLAKGEGYALYGALYEFHYLPIGQHIKERILANVDVRVLYDDYTYGDDNRAMLDALRIGKENAKPRRGTKAQKHNKFLILLKDDKPLAVWTGSTNVSAGGIFGHSNVGHAVYDPAVAARYLEYWRPLWEEPDLQGPKTREHCGDTPPAEPPNGVTVLFSPRNVTTLDWYVGRMNSAESLACLTVAFTLDERFKPVLARDTDVLRYILFDKGGDQVRITRDREVVLAVGAKLDPGELPGWRGEVLTGLNKNQYIHDKFLLVDPLSKDPIVITGSANFSEASQRSNDENMLLIRGDTRVADIYLGEFMRLFDHLYVRDVVKRATVDPSAGWLHEDGSWVAQHFEPGPKSRRRIVFRG